MRSLRTFAFACLAALAVPPAALAQAWPARPVTMIVPFPAGGNADVLARALAGELSEKLGQQFVIDNRAGAGGNIGGAAAAKAAPDGYTFMFGTPGPIATNKLMYKSLPYDPAKDLVPVVLVAKSPLIVVAHPAFPAKDLKELIGYARQNPDKVNAGNPGNGTLGHITSELLQQHTGTRMTHVPYRGTTPLTTDLLGGQINVGLDFMSTYIPLVKDGKLRALATTLKERSPMLPEVPTIYETLPQFSIVSWGAIFGPAGMPRELVQRLNRELVAAMKKPEVIAAMERQGVALSPSTPEQLAAYLKEQIEAWKRTVASAAIQPE